MACSRSFLLFLILLPTVAIGDAVSAVDSLPTDTNNDDPLSITTNTAVILDGATEELTTSCDLAKSPTTEPISLVLYKLIPEEPRQKIASVSTGMLHLSDTGRVSGHLSNHAESFLRVTWKNPTESNKGVYQCEAIFNVNIEDPSGGQVVRTKEQTIGFQTVTPWDIFKSLHNDRKEVVENFRIQTSSLREILSQGQTNEHMLSNLVAQSQNNGNSLDALIDIKENNGNSLNALIDRTENKGYNLDHLLNLTKNNGNDLQSLPSEPPKTCSDVKSPHARQTTQLANGMNVLCDTETDGGGWLVFQRRVDGNVDFYRSWNDYKEGFGSLEEDFWLGNEKLAVLTQEHTYELRVDLIFNNKRHYALYNNFTIAGEDDKFRLDLGSYSGGDAGDSMNINNNKQFTTFDSGNDEWSSTNCAKYRHGAWWYDRCTRVNLNGLWASTEPVKGLEWYHLTGTFNSVTLTEMKIRVI